MHQHEKLKMCCISAKFLPRLVTDDQKEIHVENCNCLRMQMVKENLPKIIITGDGTCVYGYDVETKMLSWW
jgi:hypothetical protein